MKCSKHDCEMEEGIAGWGNKGGQFCPICKGEALAARLKAIVEKNLGRANKKAAAEERSIGW